MLSMHHERTVLLSLSLGLAVLGMNGCSSDTLGGAALGGAAVGGAYEYQNKQAMDELEAQYRAGRISRDEYQRRKQEIENRSLVY